MPSINVRFSPQQHEALRAAAYAERISIQRLILQRLFTAEPKAAPEKKSK